MTRVAILGGGPAGIATAFHLTATPELRERFEVTVYTLGWRLGGKCASGRSGPSRRIEEHGLHVWFGFYRNAFALMEACWAELGRDPAAARAEAFVPCDTIVLYERDREAREFVLPRSPRPFEFWTAVDETLAWLRRIGAPEPRRRHVDLPGLLDDLLDQVDDVRDDLRFVADTLDLCATIVRGLAADGALPPHPLDHLNGEDLRAWLARHGARRRTLADSPILQALYDLVFAYEGGDKRRPNLAAGKAIQALLRIAFTYEGSVLHKMTSGMGDTVFTPLYEVLRARGVHFEFFRRARRLVPDGRSVAAIELVRQAEVDAYEPLVDGVWPAQADPAQVPVARDYERADPPGAPVQRLERGADFDLVVAAIPPIPLRAAAQDLCALDAPLEQALATAGTVATHGVQLWLGRTAAELGWPHGDAIAAGLPSTPDTYSTMDQLIAAENAPATRHIAYFCGVLADVDGPETQEQADARARAGAAALDTGRFWPREPDVIDRYARANVHGSDRYTLTLAGTVGHRLAAHESGFENLFLAGDWTRNGIDGGAVEAAVTSGLQAARAIRGEDPEATPGMTGWLERDGFRARAATAGR